MLENAAVSPGPARARLLALLGDAYRLADRLHEARTAYEQSLKEDSSPSSETVLKDLADLLNEPLDLREEAIRVWKHCIQDYPHESCAATAHLELARIEEGKGRIEEAERHLRILITGFEDRPEEALAFVELGRLLIDRENWKDAEDLFKDRIGDHDPTVAEASLVGLMRVRLAQGRLADLRMLSQKYEERFPDGYRRSEVIRLTDVLGSE